MKRSRRNGASFLRAGSVRQWPGMAILPLDDVTILDLSRVMAGPFASMLLADFGARVIKIEHPDGGDDTRGYGPPFVGGESTYFLSANRNKRSLAVDLKTAGGRAVVRRLAAPAARVLENLPPGPPPPPAPPRRVVAWVRGPRPAGGAEGGARPGSAVVRGGGGGPLPPPGPPEGPP